MFSRHDDKEHFLDLVQHASNYITYKDLEDQIITDLLFQVTFLNQLCNRFILPVDMKQQSKTKLP